ncbi:MAG: InlB B-repeat-containing protein [Kiritimatiellae bacterium]|nr:InlB B-repeat-containing protein [Kiritimatiellia bacterium]
MATAETLYRINGRYYTAAGRDDYYFENPDSTFTPTPVQATRYDVTVKALDPASCTIWYDGSGDGSPMAVVRTENEKRVTRRENDNASNVITFHVYKVNSNFVFVYGAHPAHPGYCRFYTAPSGCVKVVPTSGGKYVFMGALTFIEGQYDSAAANLASGTEYNSAKITYNNSSHLVWFGTDVGLDKSYAILCGYVWFLAVTPLSFTLQASLNQTTRTVANGKKRALVTDIEDYNSGSNASLSTKASTGSVTFNYWYVMRTGLGLYMPNYTSRILRAATAQSSDGDDLVLRGVNTKSDGSGTFYPVGADIAEVVTRRPSYDTYDFRVMLYGVFARRWSVTVEANGGTGADAFYYSPDTGSFYADQNLTETVAALSPYTKASAQFIGLFTTDSPTGTRAVAPDGAFEEGWTPSNGDVLYAQWRVVFEVTLDKEGGTGGADAVWYDSGAGGFVLPNSQAVVTAVSVPVLECYAFLGYFSAASGGTQLIGPGGTLLDALTSSPPASATTLHAQWDRVSWKMSLDPCDGSGGNSALFCDGVNSVFYRDDQLQSEADPVEIPSRTGHAFLGFYTAASGGTQCVDADGHVVMSAFAANGTLYAQWQPKTYTVTFDYGIGSGSEETRTVTWNQPIGALPAVTAPTGDYEFDGWTLDGAQVTASSPWLKDADSLLVAKWVGAFGDVTDYFGLASARLVPFSSDSGDNKQRLAVRHYGRFEGGDQNSIAWRNPTVSYMVVGDMTLDVHLGRAFAAQSGVTGYMITSVRVETAIGSFPVVVVSAVANEGANSINDFHASIPIVARARPQALLGSVSGGGELQSLTLTLAADPVVLAENMQPCASDIVNGRIEVEAETLSTHPSSAPTAGGDFHGLGVPQAGSGTDFTRWRISARKEL